MTVAQILQGVRLRTELPAELAKAPVAGLEYDSRRVQPGFLFFAFAGARADGREFAQQALEKGAVAVVSELESAAGFAGTMDSGRARPACAGTGRAQFLWRAG